MIKTTTEKRADVRILPEAIRRIPQQPPVVSVLPHLH